MGIEIDVVVGYPINDEVERVLGLAEAVGEPVTVSFLWEGREEAQPAPLVGVLRRSRSWPTQRNSGRSRSFVVA